MQHKTTFSLLVLFLILSTVGYSQTTFEFLPDGISFLPLRANKQEAKIGVLYYPDNANLKVDIGNNMDLLGFQFDKDKKLTFGIEFMAYANVIGYEQLRLQIDAIDGFFGGNAIYQVNYDKNQLAFRFRFIHNSAHLVDGNWWIHKYPRNWTKPGGPIPYTRDFAELMVANSFNLKNYHTRVYSGFAYSFRVRPSELKRPGFSSGFEIHNSELISSLFEKPTILFIANHFTLEGVPKYSGTNHLQGGIKFGELNSKGIIFYLSYFSGNNLFSEYYSEKLKKFGIGFTVDFP
ncbi:MAG TPA: DUF1207 domain-containing protein [Ignavibacteriaceae bacterium]|nr:DUF1207 domain-containing protein [Ignavibacteriaceae bacterium]